MLPFSVFRRGSRPYFYVAFKNEETGEYLPAISTKKKFEKDAVKQAWAWYRDGIPRRGGSLDIKTFSLRDAVHRADISSPDAEFIVDELRRRGFVLSCVFAGSSCSVPFADYLSEFWDWDRSPYIREKLRAEHSIHRNYVSAMARVVKNYWVPFFPSVLLGELTSADLDRFIDHLATIRYGKNDSLALSNIRKNDIMKAGVVPLRWAYRKSKIDFDITRNLVFFSGQFAERLILSPQQAAAVFAQEWGDQRSYVANITAMVTGLRAGELQGLQTADVGDGFLQVRHSWNRWDKLKTTKTNAERRVEVPFPFVLQSLRFIASLNPHGIGPDSFVFWSSLSPNKPMEQKRFIVGLRNALVASGMTEAAAGAYSFHSWRHFFTTYMRDKLAVKLLQSQTGHKSEKMIRRYSDHVLPGERDKIRAAQVEVFSALLPSG